MILIEVTEKGGDKTLEIIFTAKCYKHTIDLPIHPYYVKCQLTKNSKTYNNKYDQ